MNHVLDYLVVLGQQSSSTLPPAVVGIVSALIAFAVIGFGAVLTALLGKKARLVRIAAFTMGLAGLLGFAIATNIAPSESKNFGESTIDYVLAIFGIGGLLGLMVGGGIWSYEKRLARESQA